MHAIIVSRVGYIYSNLGIFYLNQIQKPLRSKHCKVADRCVAKFDHYCPWTNNAVGLLNHRYFMGFIISLVVGVMVFDAISFEYLSLQPSIPV